MTSPIDILLTNTNYFSWKSHMEDVLRSKGLYQITLGKELEPVDDEKKVKWANKSDRARGIIRMSISSDLRFHLQGIDALDAAWTKLKVVFGKHNIIRAHHIEDQLMTLSPNDFSCVEDYLSKFKTLRLLCIDCKKDIKEDQCIYIILSKLGNAYYVFVSTFYATRDALENAYKDPNIESFCDALIREKDKLVQLGVTNIASTSNKALVA
jgi:hypothetical protein